jgi:hypothetical protein
MLLHRIVTTNQARWRRGQQLSRLQIKDDDWAELIRLLQRTLDRRGGSIDNQFGALLLIAGARGFLSLTAPPFTYGALGAVLGLGDRLERMGAVERDAMEQGARVLGIDLVRWKGHRLFRATMLLHSGGGFATFEALTDEISGRGLWEAFEGEPDSELDELLSEMARSLRADHRRLLETEEGRRATLERCQRAARVRSCILERGLLRSDPEQTLEALRASGDDFAELLGVPSEAAARKLLTLLLPFADVERSRPARLSLRLELTPGSERLVLVAPDVLDVEGDDLANHDRFRLALAGAGGRDRALYVVDSDGRRARRDTRRGATLGTPSAGSTELVVLAEVQRGETTVERPFRTLRLPSSGVLLFDDDGKPRAALPHHGRVWLVAASGWRVEGFGTPLALPGGLWATCGDVVDGRIAAEIVSEDVRLPLQIGAGSLPLEVELDGRKVDGARIGQAPVFVSSPRLRLARARRVQWILSGPGGFQARGQLAVRVGIPVDPWPALVPDALYQLLLVDDTGSQARLRFGFFPRLEIRRAQASDGQRVSVTTATRPLRLHCDALGAFGELEILLPKGTTSAQLRAAVPGVGVAQETLTFDVRVRTAFLANGRDETSPTNERDLDVLRPEGGLCIHGEPGDEVTLSLTRGDTVHRYELRLDASGQRWIPLAYVDPVLTGDLAEPLRIRAQFHHATEMLVAELRNYRAERPTVALVEGILRIEAPPRALADDLHLEAVPAWAPWTGASRHTPLLPVEHNGQPWLELPWTEDRPHIVALFRGDERVSGMRLVRGDAGPPEHAEELERMLWSLPPEYERIRPVLRRMMAGDRGADLVVGLLKTFARYGSHWFSLGRALREELAGIRLQFEVESLVSGDGRNVLWVLELFERAQTPWWTVRNHDIAQALRCCDTLSGTRCADVLRHLHGLGAGFLVPAWLVLATHLGEEPAREFLPLLGELQRPRPLRSDEIEVLRVPEMLPDDLRGHRRLVGLFEARRRSANLPQVTRAIIDTIVDQGEPGDLERLRSLSPHRIDDLLRTELAVLVATRAIDRVRRGDGLFSQTTRSQLGKLQRELPVLVAHWLDMWAADGAA